MKKAIINNAGIYFYSIIGGLLFSLIVNYPIRLIFTELNDVGTLVGGISDLIGSLGFMFVLGFKSGYKRRILDLKKIILSLLIVLGVVVAFGVIVGNAVYVTGPTDFLATYFFEKTNPDLYHSKEALRYATDWRYSMLFSITAFVLIYSPLIIFAQCLGVKKHIKDFDKLKNKG